MEDSPIGIDGCASPSLFKSMSLMAGHSDSYVATQDAVQRLLQLDPISVSDGSTQAHNKEEEIRTTIASCQRIIKQQQDAILALGSKHNASFSRICQIPNIILEEIFIAFADGTTCDIEIFLLGHICQYWRTVALHCARLWARLRIARMPNLAVAEEMLLRSKDVPLDVDVLSPYNIHHINLVLNAKHISRLRRLYLTTAQQNSEAIAQRLEGASQLKTLIAIHGREHNPLLTPENREPNITSECFPLLTSLTISGLKWVWLYSLASHTITSFEVTLHSKDLDSGLEFTLYHALCRMPALEKLSLSLSNVSPPPIVGDKIRFPHLKALHLDGKAAQYGDWLERLDISHAAEVQISFAAMAARSQSREDVAYCPDVLSALFQSSWGSANLPGDTPLCLTLYDFPSRKAYGPDVSQYVDLHICLQQAQTDTDNGDTGPVNGLLRITLPRVHEPRPPRLETFDLLWRALPRKQIRSVQLVSKQPRPMEWTVLSDPAVTLLLVRNLRAVEAIHATNVKVEVLDDILRDNFTTGPFDLLPPLVLPYLQHLTLEQMELSDGEEHKLATNETLAEHTATPRGIILLRRIAERCEKYSWMLKELRLVDCTGIFADFERRCESMMQKGRIGSVVYERQ